MKEKSEEQVGQWLKKLEQESWQLELLVSAFTIFLLIGAQETFEGFIIELSYDLYGFAAVLIFILGLVQASIIALTAFLIIHLLLRGFWIGAIGLRSVQSDINYGKLNYSDFFQDKLKKKLIGLDRLVIVLDELCSVIFSVSFLIIFMIFSFGLYFLFLALFGGTFRVLMDLTGFEFAWVRYLVLVVLSLILLTGIIYLIDYFTLGFFKRFKRLSKFYYPIYRFYSTITLSFISRSIYYNLISKYSKKRIRILLSFFLIALLSFGTVNFDQYMYFPEGEGDFVFVNNYYDDLRGEDEYVKKVSVPSKLVSSNFLTLFIRYNVKDNPRIRSNCPEVIPLKNEGFNSNLKFEFKEGLHVINEGFEEEDKGRLLHCLSEFYEVSINDSVYTSLDYYFSEHPAQRQKGIQTVISSRNFKNGENVISVKIKYFKPSDSVQVLEDFARIPVWFSKD